MSDATGGSEEEKKNSKTNTGTFIGTAAAPQKQAPVKSTNLLEAEDDDEEYDPEYDYEYDDDVDDLEDSKKFFDLSPSKLGGGGSSAA